MGLVAAPTSEDIVNALRLGPATLDVLLARLGQVDPDAMWWAVEEAVRKGLVSSSEQIECGPDGVCGSSAPTILALPRS